MAAQVVADDYRPDLILGIARGGLLVAGALSYALDVKNAFTMNVEFYTGVDERLPVPMLLPPVPELVDLHDARMLIADDVADTGQTLALVKGFCSGQVGEFDVLKPRPCRRHVAQGVTRHHTPYPRRIFQCECDDGGDFDRREQLTEPGIELRHRRQDHRQHVDDDDGYDQPDER